MMGISFFQNSKSHGTIPPHSDTAIKVSTSGGTVIGQLGFGYLADVVGRKKMYGLELIIIIFATLAQALSAPSHAMSITGIIIFWRVLMVCFPRECFLSCSISTNKTPRVSELVEIIHYRPSLLPSSPPPNGEEP